MGVGAGAGAGSTTGAVGCGAGAGTGALTGSVGCGALCVSGVAGCAAAIGSPHIGHALERLDARLPHFLHLINAILNMLCYSKSLNYVAKITLIFKEVL